MYKLIIAIILIATNAQAAMDLNCMAQCEQQGNQYGLCVRQCSY